MKLTKSQNKFEVRAIWIKEFHHSEHSFAKSAPSIVLLVAPVADSVSLPEDPPVFLAYEWQVVRAARCQHFCGIDLVTGVH